MFIEPEYKESWFNRKCTTCGKKTRERVRHRSFDLEDWCEVYVWYSPWIPQHHDCHDKNKCSLHCDWGYNEAQIQAILNDYYSS